VILGFALWAGIAAVTWCAWPSCRRRAARGWLLATMLLLPWVAWLYWLPRGVRFRWRYRWPRSGVAAPLYQRLANRRARRRSADLSAHHRTSVRFWLARERDGSPTEQAIAPQMLAFLNEARMARSRPAFRSHSRSEEGATVRTLDEVAKVFGMPPHIATASPNDWPSPRPLDNEY